MKRPGRYAPGVLATSDARGGGVVVEPCGLFVASDQPAPYQSCGWDAP